MLRVLIFILIVSLSQSTYSQVYTKNQVDSIPSYPGGDLALRIAVARNTMELSKGFIGTGRVFVTFVIRKNGILENVRILRGINSKADDIALKTISQLDGWNPGFKNGKTVDVELTIPVDFPVPDDQDIYKMELEYYNYQVSNTKLTGAQKLKIFNRIGSLYYFLGQYEKAWDFYQKILENTAIKIDEADLASTYNNLATICSSWGRYEKALEYYNKAVESKVKQNKFQDAGRIYYEMGMLCFQLNNIEKAKGYFQKSLSFDLKLNNPQEEALTYNLLGETYYKTLKIDSAKVYFEKYYEMNNKMGNNEEAAMALNNLGNIEHLNKNFSKAIEYYLESIKLKEIKKNEEGIAITSFNVANSYLNKRDTTNAEAYYIKSKKIAENLNLERLRLRNLLALANIISFRTDCSGAIKLLQNFNEITSKLSDIESDQISEIGMKYKDFFAQEKKNLLDEIRKLKREGDAKNIEISKVQKDLDQHRLISMLEKEKLESSILLKENENAYQKIVLKKRNILLLGLCIIFILVFFILIAIYKRSIERKRNNETLTIKNKKIESQNREITNSIIYAQRIQQAILPQKEYLDKIIPNCFIFLKPKDIVSGDFYWVSKINDKLILTASDSTGHGVPGAFMSLLGTTYLNQIVNERKITQPNLILNALRISIIESLKQHGQEGEQKDGMDMALATIDLDNSLLNFSGANNPLYLIRNNELIQFKGDKMPVSIHLSMKDFSNTEIRLQKGDLLYLFSDGYADQFGGKDDKKYSYKRLRELLIEIHKKPLEDQKNLLELKHNEWKDGGEQIDDILIIGVKI